MTSLAATYKQACDEAAVRPNSVLTRCFAATTFAHELQVLSLSSNLLGSRGLTALLPVLRECRQSLHSLDLSRNELDSASVRQLAHFFSRGGFTALRRVELRGNPFTYQAGKHLVHWCDGTQLSQVKHKVAGMLGSEKNASTTVNAHEGSIDLWNSAPIESSIFCPTVQSCEEAEVHINYIGVEDTLMPPGLIKALQRRLADAVARREHRRSAGASWHRSYNSERLGSPLPIEQTMMGGQPPQLQLSLAASAAPEREDIRAVEKAGIPQLSAGIPLAPMGETGGQDADAEAMPTFLQDPDPTTTDFEADATKTTTTTTTTAAANWGVEPAIEELPDFLADSTNVDAVAGTAAPVVQPASSPHDTVPQLTQPPAAYDDTTPHGTPLATSGNAVDVTPFAVTTAATLAEETKLDPLSPPPPPTSGSAAVAERIGVEGIGSTASSLEAARQRARSSADTAPYAIGSGSGPLSTGTTRPPFSSTFSSAEAMTADEEAEVAAVTDSQTNPFLPPEAQGVEEPSYAPVHRTASDILDALEMPAAPAEDPDAPPSWLMEG